MGGHPIAGFAKPGFEAVREAFLENFERRDELGFAYVPNRNDFYLMDPRQNALRAAMYRSIGETDPILITAEPGPGDGRGGGR